MEGVTVWIDRWQQNSYKDVQHASLFRQLDQQLQTAQRGGYTVQFWKIGRGSNEEADELAKSALEEDDRVKETRWKRWLGDRWYGEIVSCVLFDKISGIGFCW